MSLTVNRRHSTLNYAQRTRVHVGGVQLPGNLDVEAVKRGWENLHFRIRGEAPEPDIRIAEEVRMRTPQHDHVLSDDSAAENQAADIADVPAIEVINTVAVHLMSAAAVKLGLADDPENPARPRRGAQAHQRPRRPGHRRRPGARRPPRPRAARRTALAAARVPRGVVDPGCSRQGPRREVHRPGQLSRIPRGSGTPPPEVLAKVRLRRNRSRQPGATAFGAARYECGSRRELTLAILDELDWSLRQAQCSARQDLTSGDGHLRRKLSQMHASEGEFRLREADCLLSCTPAKGVSTSSTGRFQRARAAFRGSSRLRRVELVEAAPRRIPPARPG